MLGLESRVVFHGQVETPFELIQSSDLMMLPSESEGIPRAALESLYLGIPCILRSVDGNQELISDGVNGYLFTRDSELPDVTARALASIRARTGSMATNLLPPQFRQSSNVQKYLDLILSAP